LWSAASPRRARRVGIGEREVCSPTFVTDLSVGFAELPREVRAKGLDLKSGVEGRRGDGGWKRRKREETRQKSEGQRTHSDPSRDEIDLVENENDALVRLLLLEEIEDGPAHRAHWVACVEDVDDDVRRVEDLVELSPDPARLALGVDALASLVARVVVAGRSKQLVDGDCETDAYRSALGAALRPSGWVKFTLGSLLLAVVERNLVLERRGGKLLERADLEVGPLALGLRAKGVGERLGLDNVRALQYESSRSAARKAPAQPPDLGRDAPCPPCPCPRARASSSATCCA
jgi:hypothetical protein